MTAPVRAPSVVRTGVNLTAYRPEQSKPVEGVHYPKGIQQVDLDMLFGQITFELIAACESDEALRDVRTRVRGLLALKGMQELARRV